MPVSEAVLTVVHEWIVKAEHDLTAAAQILKLGKATPTETVGFHAQQCVEKYLKALLQEQEKEVIKTHDLVFLLERIIPIKPLWSVYRSMLEHLNDYAVDSRYPGEEISKEEAVQAVKFMSEIRDVIREEIE